MLKKVESGPWFVTDQKIEQTPLPCKARDPAEQVSAARLLRGRGSLIVSPCHSPSCQVNRQRCVWPLAMKTCAPPRSMTDMGILPRGFAMLSRRRRECASPYGDLRGT